MSLIKHERRKHYKICLNNAVERLPKSLYRSFKHALSPHKFSLELYVPKNLLDQHKVEGGNYLRNKLVTFNDNYNQEKEILYHMKKESDEFSRQYQLVTQNPTYDDIKRNSKQTLTQNSNNAFVLQTQPNEMKRSKYFNELLEKYKMLGYNEEEITLSDNIFKPSLLLDNSSNYDRTCEMEKKEDLNEDKCFLSNFQLYLNNRKGIPMNKGLTRTNSPLNTIHGYNHNDSKFKHFRFNSMNTGLSLPMLNEITNGNNRLQNDIQLTKKTLDDCLMKDKEGNDNEKGDKRGKTILVDGVFLSSKGMLRSAQKGKNSQIYKGNKINKSVDFKANINNNDNKNNVEGNKITELTKLYNKLNKSGYNEGFSNINKYINRYHKDKLKHIW